MSLADSLTLSWDLASLPAFFAARSRFCADLAPCVCEHGGQRSIIGDQAIMVGGGAVVMGVWGGELTLPPPILRSVLGFVGGL